MKTVILAFLVTFEGVESFWFHFECISPALCAVLSVSLVRLQFDMLEMDRLERQLVNLPLLQDPSSYIPDTVDLSEDALAREYWLYCFEEALDGVRGREPATGLLINIHTLHDALTGSPYPGHF